MSDGRLQIIRRLYDGELDKNDPDMILAGLLLAGERRLEGRLDFNNFADEMVALKEAH